MPQLATEASHPSSLKMLWGIIRNCDTFRIFLWADSLKSCRTDRDGQDLLSQLMMQRTRPRGIVTTGLRITSSNKFGSCHVMLSRILQSFLTLYQDSNLNHWRCEIARSPPKSQATLWFCKKKSTSYDEMQLQKAFDNDEMLTLAPDKSPRQSQLAWKELFERQVQGSNPGENRGEHCSLNREEDREGCKKGSKYGLLLFYLRTPPLFMQKNHTCLLLLHPS